MQSPNKSATPIYADLHCRQRAQNADVAQRIAGLVYRGFRDEGAMGKVRIAQDAAERLGADRTVANMFVTVKFASLRRLRVIAVPHLHSLCAEAFVNPCDCLFVTFSGHNVVSRDVRVTGVQADVDRRTTIKHVEQIGYLIQFAAHAELAACGVFNEDTEL